tara:strand:+ start:551 stop:700 length:150 start_codon:yes stop_codon:yes gene_type:complete
MLAAISSKNTKGIISIGGKTKDKLETVNAENPKPLNPLIIEATEMHRIA